MSLVSKSIPNLINGVSQQPAALRLESQGEVQENGFSDVVDGLKKRPPTKFLKTLRCIDPVSLNTPATNAIYEGTPSTVRATKAIPNISTAFFHTYKRSDDEIYLVIITQTDHTDPAAAGLQLPVSTDYIKRKVLVYNVAGVLVYESGIGSWNNTGVFITGNTDQTHYLPDYTASTTGGFMNVPSTSFNEDLKATSVADATFFVNKKKVILESAGGYLTSPTNRALVYLKSVNYGRQYKISIKGTATGSGSALTKAAITPQQITTVTNDDQTINSNGLKTSTIINTLRSISGVTVEPATFGSEPYFIVDPNFSGDFTIKATDDDGGVNLKAFKDNAKSFTDLPNQCEHGFILGVVGDNQKKEDDFYVRFEGTGGSGFWRECAVPNTNNGLDLTTMPHQLKQNADLSFTFGQGAWDVRKCGDENTNSFPSFINSTISDIFFHRNRLGVLSGENVIFSGASDYYNFFRTTVRSLLDSDPIDVAVSQNEVSDLQAAVPLQDNLLLFSNLNQFTLSATQLLTPAEVTVEQSTKYECDLKASPVASGNSVFFATKSGGYAGVREFFTRETTEVTDATSITSHVPSYLEGRIKQFATSANEDMLVARVTGDTDEAKSTLYVYKWYNSASERLQSSWSKWTFKFPIAHIFFTNNLLYITYENGCHEELDVKYDKTKELVDHQLVITASNIATTSGSGSSLVGSVHFPEGYLGRTTVNSNTYTMGADHIAIDLSTGQSLGTMNANALTAAMVTTLQNGNSILIGVPYTFKFQLSEQVFKPVQGDITQLARFQLRKMSFNFNDTGHFDVTVDSVGRSPLTSHFTGRVLDNQHNLLDQAAIIDDGSFQVGVQAQATDTAITITNDSHLPSTFQSAEWEGYIVLRNKRL
tara:strand:+ start:473 stop:3106 length:2634 start_codon:yes stop_codon:yes gene_type:complete